jgi:hypothetical protein
MSIRLLYTVLLAGLLVGGCDVGTVLTPADSGDGGDDGDVFTGSAATGLDIDKIAIYQGVEIVLWENGQVKTSEYAPVIARRPGVIRTFVDRHDDFEDRDIKGVLTLTDGENVTYIEGTAFIDEDSKQNKLGSTVNFYLDESHVLVNSEIAVELIEVDSTTYGGSVGDVVVPEEGTAALNAKSSDTVEVVLIPVKYNADGSGRMPDTKPKQRERYANLLQGMYPTKEFVVSVGDTLNWNKTISAEGNGWSSLLNTIINMRSSANVDPQTYYYGVFEPEESFYSFCSWGCILGLSTLGGPNDVWSRASIGLGYTGDTSAETMVHEVGHAHGREHAPCGLGGQSSDNRYPYKDAELGVWGYDIINNELIKASSHYDMMSYCSPIWISDYSFGELYDRVKAIKSQRSVRAADAERSFRSIRVEPNGETIIGDMLTVFGEPEGALRMVDWLDADGALVKQAQGYFYPYSHLDGGIVLVEEPAFEIVGAKLATSW